MASALLLEFEGVDQKTYEAVNKELGLNPYTGEGNWPDGLVNHVASLGDGSLTVVEVWSSTEEQAKFFETRLGPALAKVGLPAPARMVWSEVIAHHVP